MAERGYSKGQHTDTTLSTGCICPEEFDHGGKCENRLRERKSIKCQPCSSGWHHPWPCEDFVRKGSHLLSLTTQCERCGWDSAEHPLTEGQRALIVDSRAKRDGQGRVVA